MKKLGVLKENEHDKIVSLNPSGIEKLKNIFSISIESGAGLNSGYSDKMYEEAGAKVIKSRNDLIDNSDIILSFGSMINTKIINEKKVFVGFYNVLNNNSVIYPYIGKAVDVYSLDLMPRISIAQAMDIITSVASISGYQAVLTAAEMSPMVIPMVSSAGGTLRPAKFLVLGAGVAGLQAIATAKRLGANVKAFDVRHSAKQEIESLGAKFIEISGSKDDKSAGGYAVEQSEEYLQLMNERIAQECIEADVIITTAKIPGKMAPKLISRLTVDKMKPGSVIIDLAAENGGNCELTKRNEIFEYNGVQIVGLLSLLNRCSSSISDLLSNNFSSFLNYYNNHQADASGVNEILKATKVVENGRIINEYLINEVIAL